MSIGRGQLGMCAAWLRAEVGARAAQVLLEWIGKACAMKGALHGVEM